MGLSPDRPDPSLVMRKDGTEPLRRALAFAGRSFTLLCKPGKAGHHLAERAPENLTNISIGSKADFTALIRREIDSGRPMIGFGIVGPPEACIITGYRDDGKAGLGWSFFEDMPEFSGEVEKHLSGYFIWEGQYEHQETLAVMAIGGQSPERDEREFLIDTLEYALSVMTTGQVLSRAGGANAFDAWAEALLEPVNFPAAPPLPLLFERLMCHCDAIGMIAKGGWYASLFLSRASENFPQAREALLQAAAAFRQQHDVSWKLWELIGGMGMGETQARNLGKPRVREESANLIRQTKTYYQQAARKLERVLAQLRG